MECAKIYHHSVSATHINNTAPNILRASLYPFLISLYLISSLYPLFWWRRKGKMLVCSRFWHTLKIPRWSKLTWSPPLRCASSPHHRFKPHSQSIYILTTTAISYDIKEGNRNHKNPWGTSYSVPKLNLSISWNSPLKPFLQHKIFYRDCLSIGRPMIAFCFSIWNYDSPYSSSEWITI